MRLSGVIDAAVAQLREELVGTLRELVRIPSITGSEGMAQEFMYRQYEALNLKNIRLTAQREKIENHPAYCGANKPYEGRPNIIGGWTSSFGECPTITAITYVVLKKKTVKKINLIYELNNVDRSNA